MMRRNLAHSQFLKSADRCCQYCTFHLSKAALSIPEEVKGTDHVFRVLSKRGLSPFILGLLIIMDAPTSVVLHRLTANHFFLIDLLPNKVKRGQTTLSECFLNVVCPHLFSRVENYNPLYF
ncbi:hypothetical protein EMIT0P265_90008 [Pseudomonas zeae]